MAKIKIRAEKIEYEHLSMGDLYCWAKEEVSDHLAASDDVPVIVRGDGPIPKEHMGNVVYKLTVSGNARQKTKEIAFRMDPHIPPGFKEEI